MNKCSKDINKILGENIRTIRKSNNLTQEQLADKLNINTNYLSQIENGKSSISLDTAIKICQITNSSTIALFKNIIASPNKFENYDLLNDKEKELVSEIIVLLIKQHNSEKQ